MPAWKGTVARSFTAQEFRDYVNAVEFNGWRPQFVVLHNTGSPTMANWHSVPGDVRMRNLENYYRNQKKWSAGPHLFVADDVIWVFTPLNVSGVHSPSWNQISWGVEMVGDFDTEPFGPATRDNAVAALAALHARLGIDPATLKLHREDPLTTHACPGRLVSKAAVMQDVAEALAALEPGEHVPGAIT